MQNTVRFALVCILSVLATVGVAVLPLGSESPAGSAEVPAFRILSRPHELLPPRLAERLDAVLVDTGDRAPSRYGHRLKTAAGPLWVVDVGDGLCSVLASTAAAACFSRPIVQRYGVVIGEGMSSTDRPDAVDKYRIVGLTPDWARSAVVGEVGAKRWRRVVIRNGAFVVQSDQPVYLVRLQR
jgi:hypothetical protein